MSYSSGKITTGNLTLISDSSDNITASLTSFGIKAQTVNASVINATTSIFGTDSSGNIIGSVDVSGQVYISIDLLGSLTVNNISYFTPDTLFDATDGFNYLSNYQYNYRYPIDTTQEIINNLITIPGSVFDTIGVDGSGVDFNVFVDVSGEYVLNDINEYIINSNGNAVVWDGSGSYPFLTNEVLSITSEGDIDCAFERWPLIIALSRFGTFKGLENMQSATWEPYENIQSFTFRDLIYDSSYFTLKTVEYDDIFGTLLPQYTNLGSYYAGVIKTLDPLYETPFISFGNNWILNDSPVSAAVLEALSRSNISNYLTDVNNTITQDIISSANYITACLSVVTGNQPTSVCDSSGVMAAKAALGI